jgi:hypothetical protein
MSKTELVQQATKLKVENKKRKILSVFSCEYTLF